MPAFAGCIQDTGPSGLMKDYRDSIILNNGVVSVTLTKYDANIISYKYKGIQMLIDGYYSMDGKATMMHLKHCVVTVASETTDLIDVSFKSTWQKAYRQQAVDIDVHYVMQKGKSGVYSYAVLTHPKTYPDVTFGEWRMVWKMDMDRFDHIMVDSIRNRILPSKADMEAAKKTSIPEAVKLTTGVMKDQYECKYSYSVEYHDVGTFGHASTKDKVGAWMVLGGYDYFNDGPTQADLNAGLAINIVHFGRDHYSGSGTTVAAGEDWSKIYGPFLLYVNSGANADAMWADAKKQVKTEKAAWPYAWIKNNAEYPAKAQRGIVSGTFAVHDPYKPKLTGAYAWVGLSSPGVHWEKDSRTYQYWIKADAKGNFTIPDVRPGTYDLHAFVTGAVDEYTQQGIVVNTGKITNAGLLTRNIIRDKGNLLWEIGIPDRKTSEFKFGDKYFEPFMWETYSRVLPNPLVYDADKGDWKDKLNYAHSNYYTPDSTFVSWPWNINFKLKAVPQAGFATLTFAIAGIHNSSLRVYINGESQPTGVYMAAPEVYGGNALVREGNHAKYSVYTLQVPVSKLHTGGNTITLSQGHAGSRDANVMYDYICMEMP
ncbi:hypothetical protein KXQ82_03475 [Mucilaginibacter sp. HMF5004]|uniref:polysaccharide lyase family 4 protein n=1 Tax=Mucilaginibacter rivuli TaxID=2857527 RepID=UPI001C5EC853|nr:polysaccharide lyase family 4 protein [Mucilaginibacter rivuli]MBW4888754.1 hypothetical protein [Mucilaginibacter rivuli]